MDYTDSEHMYQRFFYQRPLFINLSVQLIQQQS